MRLTRYRRHRRKTLTTEGARILWGVIVLGLIAAAMQLAAQ